ncbi:hypothetical protein MCOR25_002362 [Pyricularia grisea]|uniref:PH domain-containing protein n=1 Tax=Pyricularia grisea TaxID=148305 RepID=A0A6P8ASB9_PYRGI|nr:uncharacterized protein PgNI_09824 [Pyricularia grisea]KAI6378119.1 hypothetical protein MCOR25_002362 [Pyricularia grisea]TLD05021.1 hypothetical protein PgNI_09824 [Pyricularia grisea]
MVDVQTAAPMDSIGAKLTVASSQALSRSQHSMAISSDLASRLRSQLALETFSPVNQNGCFDFDRVIKCGYLQKRTKTRSWKTVYVVMRPNTLSIYKSDKEDKLRNKIYLSDLTAVTLLKDPKQKRHNMFGLFSPSKNIYFQAPSSKDAQDWVEAVRQDARIEEEEDEIFLASPVVRQESYGIVSSTEQAKTNGALLERERMMASSPEIQERVIARNPVGRQYERRASHLGESSGLSGNELASHSDLSDLDVPSRYMVKSAESVNQQSPSSPLQDRPNLGGRVGSNSSGIAPEKDPDRVMWQGQMWFLRSKGGLRQWKKSWAVVRPRNLILYRDSSEYSPHLVLPLSSILNVVDLDPISKTKRHCLQIITEEKRFRFCAADEESLLQCLGAFKSLLARRRELEARAAATISVPEITTDLATPDRATRPDIYSTSPPASATTTTTTSVSVNLAA